MIPIPRSIYYRLSPTLSLTDLQSDLEKFRHLLDDQNRQLCLTSRPDAVDPLRDGAGRYDGLESEFSVLNEEFRGTTFEEFYMRVPFKLGRVRLMMMPPRTCYSYHVDKEPRLHVAIVTNPNAYLLIDDESERRSWKLNIPANGSIYWVNTQRTHTAINTDGASERIHLVANIVSEK